MRVIGAETSAALSLGMDWTSTLLLVEVLLAAFSSGLVFGLRSEVWSRRSSRGMVSRPASSFHPDTVVAPLAPDAEPGLAVLGRVPGAADAGPPKPPMELAVQAQAPPPVPTKPHPGPVVADPERHRELYATEYSRQIRRLKRLRRETNDGLSLAAQARPGQESAVQLDDPPIEAPEEGPRD